MAVTRPSAVVPKRRPTASQQRAIKVEIENVEVPCLLLSPGFYYTTNAHILFMHSEFDVAMSVSVRKYESDCAV